MISDLARAYLGEHDYYFKPYLGNAVACKCLDALRFSWHEDCCVLRWVNCRHVDLLIDEIGGRCEAGSARWGNWVKRYELGDPGSIELCEGNVGWVLGHIERTRGARVRIW